MADPHMRDYVASMYDGAGWKKKVARMKDGQIFAIYSREMQKKQEAEQAARAAKKAQQDDIPF